MSRRPAGRRLAPLIVLAAALPALAACLTPHARPTPSAAVVDARKGAGVKPTACRPGDLASVSPTVATFPFDEPALDAEGTARLKRAADWLACNPGVPVSILPTADNHGDDKHKRDLASARGQAASDALRRLGATSAVIHTLAMGAADPVSGPHLVIQADGRGW